MKIAQVAPLAESVPPKLYGGTERVVSWLTEELVALDMRSRCLRAPTLGLAALWRLSGHGPYGSADREPIQVPLKRFCSRQYRREHESSMSFTVTWIGSTFRCWRSLAHVSSPHCMADWICRTCH